MISFLSFSFFFLFFLLDWRLSLIHSCPLTAKLQLSNDHDAFVFWKLNYSLLFDHSSVKKFALLQNTSNFQCVMDAKHGVALRNGNAVAEKTPDLGKENEIVESRVEPLQANGFSKDLLKRKGLKTYRVKEKHTVIVTESRSSNALKVEVMNLTFSLKFFSPFECMAPNCIKFHIFV